MTDYEQALHEWLKDSDKLVLLSFSVFLLHISSFLPVTLFVLITNFCKEIRMSFY